MPRTILIVEDSATMRALIELNLKRIPNIHVIHAKDGAEALERINKERPSLILTDLAMPNLGGFELLKAIRHDQGDQTTPIVVISSTGADDEARAKSAVFGANECITKPIVGAELVEVVERLLEEESPTSPG